MTINKINLFKGKISVIILVKKVLVTWLKTNVSY
jgi:hypothetical protein